jgi:neurofibromin 1
LADHPAWKEIGVLVRVCLMLSFKNLLNVQRHLPELCHIICLLVGTGPSLIRSSIHGLAINIIHSLSTTINLGEHSLRNLTLLATELSEPKFSLLFGVNRRATNPFVITKELLSDKLEKIPLTSLETISNTLLEVMELGGTTVGNAFRMYLGFSKDNDYVPHRAIKYLAVSLDELDDGGSIPVQSFSPA